MSQSTSKVWFITGVSRGLGKFLAEQVLLQGDRVIGTTRDGKSDIAGDASNLAIIKLDVTDRDDVLEQMAQAADIFGRIDVVVNNAGYGLMGAVEEISSPQAKDQFETNFFGALNVIQAVLPIMRKQRSGHILNISSVGGFVGFPGVGLYSASKFALEGLSESLATEVAPYNIKVTIVEPGAFRTDFLTENSIKKVASSTNYPEAQAGIDFWSGLNGKQPGDPVKAAKAMIDVTRVANPPLRLLLGPDGLKWVEEKLAKVRKEIEDYRAVTVSTDLEPEATFSAR